MIMGMTSRCRRLPWPWVGKRGQDLVQKWRIREGWERKKLMDVECEWVILFWSILFSYERGSHLTRSSANQASAEREAKGGGNGGLQREEKIWNSHPGGQESKHARKMVSDGWATRRVHWGERSWVLREPCQYSGVLSGSGTELTKSWISVSSPCCRHCILLTFNLIMPPHNEVGVIISCKWRNQHTEIKWLAQGQTTRSSRTRIQARQSDPAPSWPTLCKIVFLAFECAFPCLDLYKDLGKNLFLLFCIKCLDF